MAKKKSNSIIVPDEIIISKIYFIRNQKVMLDRDLAELYGVQPIRLREQVKRNLNRFPRRFMFQLTETEVEIMVSQNAIPSKQHLGGYLPYVFTEHGVLQLSNVLKTDQAIEVSIRIIDIFVNLREILLDTTDIRLEIEHIKNKLDNQNKNTEVIFKYLDELSEKVDEIDKIQKHDNRKLIGFKEGKE